MEYATLYNGVKMPLVGLGVMLTHGDQYEQMVKNNCPMRTMRFMRSDRTALAHKQEIKYIASIIV